MKRSLFKPIVGGAFIGTALFLIPFLILKVVLFFMVCSVIFRVFAKRRMHGMGFGPNFADKIRAMSDEEYAAFKDRFQGRCMGNRNQATDESKMMI